ncbi:hypothetical protein J2129_000603 [Methanofollis sp. W23]|uniref:hypothetical protein n=1 Tax=Methanofollis sp. W23 TaxID=2817849 RepID=UPI001AE9CA04|nr:hypothetical protein [Methanofollis sp. W23]MBP2145149.1 hypothetical protein [Methanofollis sp. W23]
MILPDTPDHESEEKKKPEKIGCHGSHWNALVRTEGEVQAAVVGALEHAGHLKMIERRRTVLAALSGGEVLKTCSVVVDQELCTGYPYLARGSVHEVEVDRVEEWRSRVEGQVRGRLAGAWIAFFDTLYFMHKERYETGGRYRFSLAALAYRLRRTDPGTVTGPDGKEFSLEHMAGYFPFQGGDVDDFVFQTHIKEVREVTFGTRRVYQITAPLFRPRDREGQDDAEITLYAAEHVTGGYVPAVGDAISGVMWLQGHLVEDS